MDEINDAYNEAQKVSAAKSDALSRIQSTYNVPQDVVADLIALDYAEYIANEKYYNLIYRPRWIEILRSIVRR